MVHYNALGSSGWLDVSELRNEMEIVAGDLTDADSVRAAMRDVEVVFHLERHRHSLFLPCSAFLSSHECARHAQRPPGGSRSRHATGSYIRPRARSTARHVMCPSTRSTPSRANRPIRPAKSPRTRWSRRSIARSAYRWSRSVPSIRLAHGSQPLPAIPTIIAQCLAGKQVVRLGNLAHHVI